MVSPNQVTEPIVATFQLKMSNVSDSSTQDVAVPVADDYNPFIGKLEVSDYSIEDFVRITEENNSQFR
jgi:hypothetical protein